MGVITDTIILAAITMLANKINKPKKKGKKTK